ncbi:MAG TPA: hypothetical protein VGQ75_00060 [Thermoanaerobaculia bacterium]|nr:hypothetical protein [Thermoanaerobaculia bacterium]
MRPGYLWLASFLVFPIVGAPLLKAWAFRVFGFPTRAVLSGGVGMVLVSWTMTLFALLGIRWGPLIVLVAAAVAAALRLLPRDRVPRLPKVVPSPPGRGDGGEGAARGTTLIAYSLTALSLLAAFAATVSARSTSTDLLLFWGPKAQQFAAARTVDVGFLRAPYLEYLHVYYPPLVTDVFAFAAMVAGRFPWGAATLTFPLFLAATSVALAGILKTEAGAAPAAATGALATSAMALVGIHVSVAGNAEPFLLFFEILGLAVLLTPIARSTTGKLLAGLLFAGAAASKVEALPFVGTTIALFLAVDREARRSAIRTVLLLAGPAMVSLGTWFAFGAAKKLFFGYQGYGRTLAIRWESLPAIAADVGRSLWKVGFALPWLVPIAVLLLTPARGRRVWLPLGIAIVLAGFLLFTYATTEANVRLLISWSAARVLSPLTALLAFASFCAREHR